MIHFRVHRHSKVLFLLYLHICTFCNVSRAYGMLDFAFTEKYEKKKNFISINSFLEPQ